MTQKVTKSQIGLTHIEGWGVSVWIEEQVKSIQAKNQPKLIIHKVNLSQSKIKI